MRRKVVAIWISLVIVLGTLVIVDNTLDFIPTVEGTTRYVNTTGSGGAFTSIQNAINISIDGDTVYVYNGTYYENVVVNKTINLTGENRDTTIIDGGGVGDVIIVTVDWVNITGFAINNSGGDLDDAGLQVESDYNVILGNIASNNSYGLYFNSSSRNNITDNIVSLNNIFGIYVSSSSNNTITYNTVSSNNDKGIYIYKSSNSTINGNDVSSNNLEGIHLTYAPFNTVTNNDISMNLHGIYVYHSNYTTLNNNTCNSNNWDGIRLSSSNINNITNNTVNLNYRHGILLQDNSNNNILFNNSLSWNGDGSGHYGIILYGTQYNQILNNTIHYNKANVRGIALGGAANNVIKYNHLTGLNAMTYGISLTGSNSKNNEIAFNVVTNKGHGIYLATSANNNVISNNNVSNNRRGIYLWSSSNGNTISNNTANSNVWHGISLFEASANTITDNTANNNGNAGIRIYSVSGITVARNTVLSNIWSGVRVTYSNFCNIEDNNASYNNDYGINIEHSTSMTVSNNTMFNDSIFISGDSLNHWNTHTIDPLNTVNGKPVRYWKNQNSGTVSQIFGQVILANCSNVLVENHNATGGAIAVLMGFSSNNTINNNTISENINYGIYLYQSSNNTFKNNTLSDNNFGFYMEDSENNYVYYNNFENNPNQAFDNYANHWDNGYPLGGNYWSDYGGVDNYKGPNQDIPGSDGIGDTNHPIPGGSNVDNYPLIGSYKPIENYTILKQGWNLISIPFIQGNQNLIKVLEMINGWYDAVQWFNNSDSNDPWKHHKVGKLLGNDLFELNETMSFWIHITQPGDTIFVYNGTKPIVNQTIQLYKGWNMVGYPSLTNHNRTVGLNNLTFDTHVDAIQWYDAATQTWHFMDQDDNFVLGRGYWVHSKVDASWEVPL